MRLLVVRLANAFLRIFFRLLYNQFAWAYDTVAAVVSAGLWNQWVVSIHPYLDEDPVLELGFGTGHLQAFLLERGIQTVGLDQSRQMATITGRRLRAAGRIYSLVTGRSQYIPLSSGVFSRVVATFPSDFIVDPDTLSEIWRVLAPGGRLIVVPNAWITGESIPHRFSAWLFHITNESPPSEKISSTWIGTLVGRLSELGFLLEQTILKTSSSSLFLVDAKKPK